MNLHALGIVKHVFSGPDDDVVLGFDLELFAATAA